MPCNPSDYNIPPPDFDEPSLPGFGVPKSPDVELPGMPIPEGFPEDLLELLDKLKLILPSGTFKPNLKPGVDRTFLDGIVKLLDLLLPFLAIYKFILPILQMIICIIEVLCALTNPFKLIRALRKLFRTCIPDFLSLFPIFAIILMIISLILLIISLIEYIITEILRIINQLLRNLIILGRMAKRQDQRSMLSALRKLGSLLCYLKNILSVLQVVALLIQVIQDILRLTFKIPPCDDTDGDPDGCCTPEVCPAFIKNGDFTRTTGKLQYLNEMGPSTSSISGLPAVFGPIFSSLGAIRNESWQFWDEDLADAATFYNITEPVDVDPELGFVFYPPGKTYDENTPYLKAPFTVDLRFEYNPAAFGHVDVKGTRYIRVKNCIVTKTPDLQAKSYNNGTTGSANGVLNLRGGKVYEDDGTTPLLLNGTQAFLHTLLHKPITISDTLPVFDDSILFQNVEYTFKINHSVLVGESLITVGCVPDVAFDRTFVNLNFAGPNIDLSGIASKLPDVNRARTCLDAAIAKFSGGVTAAAAAEFQQEASACLNNLLQEAKDVLGDLVDVGVNVNKSTFKVDPSLQFTSLPIKVTATLNDNNGFNIVQGFPTDVAENLAKKLTPEITFGTISDFTYDGSANFTAEIRSEEEGKGEIMLAYNNNFIGTVTVPADLTQTPTVTITKLTYEFVKTGVGVGIGGETRDGKPRRNDGDVSRDGSE